MRKYNQKNIKWWVGTFSCVALFAVIIFFGWEKMSFIRNGVELEASIVQSSDSPLYIVEGQAPRAKHLKLNGREIFIDKEGFFREVLILQDGYSVTSLYAEDKFGKISEKEFKMYLNKNSSSFALNE